MDKLQMICLQRAFKVCVVLLLATCGRSRACEDQHHLEVVAVSAGSSEDLGKHNQAIRRTQITSIRALLATNREDAQLKCTGASCGETAEDMLRGSRRALQVSSSAKCAVKIEHGVEYEGNNLNDGCSMKFSTFGHCCEYCSRVPGAAFFFWKQPSDGKCDGGCWCKWLADPQGNITRNGVSGVSGTVAAASSCVKSMEFGVHYTGYDLNDGCQARFSSYDQCCDYCSRIKTASYFFWQHPTETLRPCGGGCWCKVMANPINMIKLQGVFAKMSRSPKCPAPSSCPKDKFTFSCNAGKELCGDVPQAPGHVQCRDEQSCKDLMEECKRSAIKHGGCSKSISPVEDCCRTVMDPCNFQKWYVMNFYGKGVAHCDPRGMDKPVIDIIHINGSADDVEEEDAQDE